MYKAFGRCARAMAGFNCLGGVGSSHLNSKDHDGTTHGRNCCKREQEKHRRCIQNIECGQESMRFASLTVPFSYSRVIKP
jgi:hypothetical protein